MCWTRGRQHFQTPVVCLQVWASSRWFWAWCAPTAAAATPRTPRARATNWWTWRWTDKHFPPHPHTAALTGNTTRTTDTRPRTITGTRACSRATDAGTEPGEGSGRGGAWHVGENTRSIVGCWEVLCSCGAWGREGAASEISGSMKIQQNLWRFQWYIYIFFFISNICLLPAWTSFEEFLRRHCHFGNKEPLNRSFASQATRDNKWHSQAGHFLSSDAKALCVQCPTDTESQLMVQKGGSPSERRKGSLSHTSGVRTGGKSPDGTAVPRLGSSRQALH